jgi:ornithine cyclodeaminase/alanine dehydrogenase-like protein (mu-crystallin family)
MRCEPAKESTSHGGGSSCPPAPSYTRWPVPGSYFGTKIYSTHPAHGAHFLFALYDANTANPLAIFEANWLGQIRTGAASGYATDLLARPGAETLGMIGSGFQARSQLEAMLAVRPLRVIRVWSRSAAKRLAFAPRMYGRVRGTGGGRRNGGSSSARRRHRGGHAGTNYVQWKVGG